MTNYNSLRSMKKFLCLLILSPLAIFLISAQQPWQKISYTEIKDITRAYKTPPADYGMILWWGWDGPVTDTVIRRDLDRIKAMGFRGVMLEAGYGMTAKYLSPEWFALVKIAVDEAAKRDMRVWIEDEGKYPSGFAGGKFSNERPDLKMQGLVITERIDVAPGEKINRMLPYYALNAVAYNNEDKSSINLEISSGELNWQAPEGNWRVFVAGHRFRSSATRSVNNPGRGKDTTASLMDYLNPLATRQFIEWTHEEYKKYIGNEFGKTFMGFMGDEPDFAYIPWSPRILDEFKARKGYDVKPWLASFFLPQMSDDARRVKADYWDVWSSLFRENFFDIQAEWCRENNIEYIVHLNHEDQLPGLVKSSGDYFRNNRNVAIPGVDAIWAQIWMDHVADYPKLASSAAHLYGRPRAFTESFAAYTHKPSVAQAKWVLDYQLVRGINWVQVMFMSASTDRPPSISATGTPTRRPPFFQNDSFPAVANYINRTSFLLTQGHADARVAVYFPTLSLWYGDAEANGSLLSTAQKLMENQYDFDFVDEQALTSFLSAEEGKLINPGLQTYSSVVVPSISVISAGALEKLRKFAESGGKVVFVGKNPGLVTDRTFLYAREAGDLPWAKTGSDGKVDEDILDLLPPSDLSLDRPCPHIKYLHRQMKDGEIYFLFNEGQEKQSLVITLSGTGRPSLWDPMTGEIVKIKKYTAVSGNISFHVVFEPFETKTFVISR